MESTNTNRELEGTIFFAFYLLFNEKFEIKMYEFITSTKENEISALISNRRRKNESNPL